MLKSIALLTISGAVLVGSLTAGNHYLNRQQPRLYPAAFEIAEVINTEDNCILRIRTIGGTLPMGEIWEYDGDPDIDPGEIMVAIMADYGTPDDETDDEILTLRWSGISADEVNLKPFQWYYSE